VRLLVARQHRKTRAVDVHHDRPEHTSSSGSLERLE
jgi:hypothetical protein